MSNLKALVTSLNVRGQILTIVTVLERRASQLFHCGKITPSLRRHYPWHNLCNGVLSVTGIMVEGNGRFHSQWSSVHFLRKDKRLKKRIERKLYLKYWRRGHSAPEIRICLYFQLLLANKSNYLRNQPFSLKVGLTNHLLIYTMVNDPSQCSDIRQIPTEWKIDVGKFAEAYSSANKRIASQLLVRSTISLITTPYTGSVDSWNCKSTNELPQTAEGCPAWKTSRWGNL